MLCVTGDVFKLYPKRKKHETKFRSSKWHNVKLMEPYMR